MASLQRRATDGGTAGGTTPAAVGVVPPPRRAPVRRVAELATRLSYDLIIGSFDLDHESGEVRFHAGGLLVTAPKRR